MRNRLTCGGSDGGVGVPIGAGAHFDGITLSQTELRLLTGRSMTDRAWAEFAPTLRQQ